MGPILRINDTSKIHADGSLTNSTNLWRWLGGSSDLVGVSSQSRFLIWRNPKQQLQLNNNNRTRHKTSNANDQIKPCKTETQLPNPTRRGGGNMATSKFVPRATPKGHNKLWARKWPTLWAYTCTRNQTRKV